MPFETAWMNFEISSMRFLVTISDGTLITVTTHQLILIPTNPSYAFDTNQNKISIKCLHVIRTNYRIRLVFQCSLYDAYGMFPRIDS